jgi:uncharacterized SAM-binding protein YcdF (DUF218 family)
MFFFLSKAIDFLVMPESLLLVMLAYGFFTKKHRHRKLVLGLAFVSFFLTANTYLVKKLFNGWEPRLRNINTLPAYDVGILLSGGLMSSQKPSADHYAMGDHGDRVLQTYQLYKAGKIRKILITGTSSDLMMSLGRGETMEAADVLKRWGVPAQDIIFEQKARNTRENALFSARILKTQFAGGRYVLITSAFHMRRSAGCFEKAGIKTDIFPADFYGGYNKLSFQSAVVPDAEAFAAFSVLWHELIGFIVYKLVGYS